MDETENETSSNVSQIAGAVVGVVAVIAGLRFAVTVKRARNRNRDATDLWTEAINSNEED